jgi:hypothetical protein
VEAHSTTVNTMSAWTRFFVVIIAAGVLEALSACDKAP